MQTSNSREREPKWPQWVNSLPLIELAMTKGTGSGSIDVAVGWSTCGNLNKLFFRTLKDSQMDMILV